MSVSRFLLPSSNLDGDLSVLARIGAAFAPHASEPESLSIVLDPGHIRVGLDLIEIPKQLAGPVVVPNIHPKIDRVVVDAMTGVCSIISGSENGSPNPPSLPVGVIPIARIIIAPNTTQITNKIIIDERSFCDMGSVSGALINIQCFTLSGIYKPSPGTRSVIVDLLGGGGSGGGCSETGAGQMAAGGGGGAGSYARGRFTSGFADVNVTVAAGIAASSAGTAGVNGNISSFGDIMTAPGGKGGTLGTAVSKPTIIWGSNGSNIPTGYNIAGGSGQGGGKGFALSSTSATGGHGGSTLFGSVSNGSLNGNSGSGNSSINNGAGGGGASNTENMPARAGGAGAAGIVIVYEFS